MNGITATGTEATVIEDIARRQAIGIAKYGMTVADNPLPLKDWLQHGYEELLDGAVYLKRALQEIELMRARENIERHANTGTAALLWVLWHHQGASSSVGQALRFALGMGDHERLTEQQVEVAKRWGNLRPQLEAQDNKAIGGSGRNEFFEGYFDGEDEKARMNRLAHAALAAEALP